MTTRLMAPPPFLERAATAAVVVVSAVSVTVEVRQVIIGRTGLGNVLDGHEDERIAAVGQMETAGVDIGISAAAWRTLLIRLMR